MQFATGALFITLLGLAAPAHAVRTNPVQKVIELLSGLEAKILKEGEEAQKVYEEFAEWCEDRSKNLGFDIKTGKAEVADLEATIEKETATAGSLNAKIEELVSSIATDEADLKAATEIRAKEAASFASEEKELTEIVDTLGRAIAILEREMQKGGASMLQLRNADSLAKALNIMVQASMFSSADASRLTALVQSSSEADDADTDMGAPAPTTYASHSGSIVETLEGLLDKANGQLDGARKKETASLHNFEMLAQSLTDEVKFANKDLAEAKAGLAASNEARAVAEGDHAVTSKALAEDEKTLGSLHQNCMTKSEEFEASTKSRGEELKALADAKKVISESTSGAESLTYGLSQVSLLQVVSHSALTSSVDLANFEAVRFVRDLARKQGDAALAQLASRMASAIRFASSDAEDPFAKVKSLITDMISRLEASAQADATHKAYCDKELAETKEKREDKSAEVEKLTTSIDKMSARSAQLKGEVAALQKELAELAASQAEMDKLRQAEHAAYTTNRADMEQGLEGVKLGLKILREYYAQDAAHGAAEGAGSGVVGLLEVIESDFSKGLAETISTEEASQAAYESQTKENEIARTMKEQDVKYKTAEATGLDKSVAEATSDRASVQAELDAVLEYTSKLRKMCDEKVEPYEERKRRREAEIAGLRQALEILEGEAVLLQGSRRTLRGGARARRA